MPDANSATGQPTRYCPKCHNASQILDSELIWPPAWTCAHCNSGLSTGDGFVQLAQALDHTDEGFDRKSFELLAETEANHFWFVTRNELIGWLITRFAPETRRALEIGCGTGFVLQNIRQSLPKAQLAGSELHTLGLSHARKRCDPSIELFQMDARDGHISNAFDLVGAFDVLEHISEDEKVLSEIYRMLRPGAHLIASVPQHPWLWSTADDLAKHQRRYKIGELAKKASAAGFHICYQTSFVTLALPLMIHSRIVARLKPTPRTLDEQTDAEFRLPPMANVILRKLGHAEHRLRRLHLPLPVGGSQVLVAQKPS